MGLQAMATILHIPKVLPVVAESVGFNLYAILFSLGTELRTL